MTGPEITIGIVSCNRLYFLKALIESARACIAGDRIQWIIVDNASIEPGLRDYLESLEFVQHTIFRSERRPSSEHVEAMNTIVEMCRSDYLMILPEDVQFIVKGDWIDDFVEVLTAFPHLGGICFNAQRRVTIERFFAPRRRLFGLGRAVEPAVYRTASGREFLGYGAAKPGIIGAGILSFARTAVWRDLGRWRATGRQTVADSSGGGEAEMLERYRDAGLRLERCLARIPVCVEIITDSVGSKARIRGNRRYGAYWPPPDGNLYYRIWEAGEAAGFSSHRPAPGFEDVAQPLGFRLPIDDSGNLLKWPHVNEDDRFEWIHPSVAAEDRLGQCT